MVLNDYQLVLCSMSARLFVLANKKGYGSVEFAELLMQSWLGNYIYSNTCMNVWLGEEYVMSLMETDEGVPAKGKQFSDDCMHWIGYLYKYWSLTQPETGNEIYRLAPIKLLAQGYPGWHCISMDLVIDDIKTYQGQFKIFI